MEHGTGVSRRGICPIPESSRTEGRGSFGSLPPSPSRRFAIIVVQQATEARSGLDRSLPYPDVLVWLNDLAVQALMISLGVVVGHVLFDGLAEMHLNSYV